MRIELRLALVQKIFTSGSVKIQGVSWDDEIMDILSDIVSKFAG